jgi:hypothetical protein
LLIIKFLTITYYLLYRTQGGEGGREGRGDRMHAFTSFFPAVGVFSSGWEDSEIVDI